MERLSPDPAGVERAAALVLAGEVVAFPTDTVYGLMALPAAAARIFEVKRRPAEKALVAMAATPAALEELVAFDGRARALAARWWPGPLTLVLPARSGGPSLAVRVPDHDLARRLLEAVGRPVLTTSANLSGEPPATVAGEVGLEGVAAVLDGGASPGGVPSTVLLADGPRLAVAREGAIAAADLVGN